MLHADWLNQNSLRAYPFEDNATRYPTIDGVLVQSMPLPNLLLLDCRIILPDAQDTQVYLSKLVVAGSLVSLSFAKTSDDVVVVSGAVDTANYADTSAISFSLSAVADETGASGMVVIGNISQFKELWPDGVYTFTSDQTRILFCNVINIPSGFSGLRLVDGDNVSELITGEVKLVAGENMRIVYDAATNTLIFHAIAGAGYSDDCGACVTKTNVVRTINGIPLQDVVLASGNSCIEIETVGSQIKITDKCSTPCCGCSELEAATQKLIDLDSRTTDIQTYRDTLERAQSLLEAALARIPTSGS